MPSRASSMQQLKELNLQRWQSHVNARDRVAYEETSSGGGAVHNAVDRHTSIASSLWNVPSLSTHKAICFRPLDRVGTNARVAPFEHRNVDNGPQTTHAVPDDGRNCCFATREVGATSRRYSVPSTSVTKKQGNIGIFCGCCGFRPKAAQWIWILNLVCFLAHSGMIYATLWFAYIRHGRNIFTETEHVMIRIYRIRTVPTQHMLDTNQSKYSEGWNLTSSEKNSGLFLYDNGMPLNFASLIIAFFATSALFHFWALTVGAFERYHSWYYGQMDNCFCYWLAVSTRTLTSAHSFA